MDKLKLIDRIFSTVVRLITIPVLILVFLERYVINTIISSFNSESLSDISDRIFNNGIETIKSIENGANHVDQD